MPLTNTFSLLIQVSFSMAYIWKRMQISVTWLSIPSLD